MQLINTHAGSLISLTISSGILATALAFPYNTFGHSEVKSVISSPSIDKFVQQTNDNLYSQLSIKSRFGKCVASWKKNTMFMSFADQIVNDINFREIVSMGNDVVPYILEEISKTPSSLVWALNFIFNKTISNNPNITIEQACKLWIKAMS